MAKSKPLSNAETYLAELIDHLSTVEADLKKDVPEIVGDVEGHLRVALAHLRALVGERRQTEPEAPETAETAEQEVQGEAVESDVAGTGEAVQDGPEGVDPVQVAGAEVPAETAQPEDAAQGGTPEKW